MMFVKVYPETCHRESISDFYTYVYLCLIWTELNSFDGYQQTYPESVCECLFSLIHSAPSRNVPYRRMTLLALLCWSRPADVVEVALDPGGSLYNPPVQTHVRQSGRVRRKPVA